MEDLSHGHECERQDAQDHDFSRLTAPEVFKRRVDQLRVINFVVLLVHDLGELGEGFPIFVKPLHIDELDFDCSDLHLSW